MTQHRFRSLTVSYAVLVALATATALSGVYALCASVPALQGLLQPDRLPGWLQQRWQPFTIVPNAQVQVNPAYWHSTPDQISGFPWSKGGPVGPRAAEFDGGHRSGLLTFWDPGLAPTLAWAVVISLPLLVLAVLWLTLARIVRTADEGTPFTLVNATRLTWVGAVLLVGPYLALVATHVVRLWMTETSSAAGHVTVMTSWSSLPLWPLGVGLALLTLAAVWRSGVRLREDVDGLV